MKLEKIEIFIHDILSKTPKIRHFLYFLYQHLLYAVSSKEKSFGDLIKLTPDDGKEYFFGYYDKSPWNRTGDYLLCLRVNSTRKNVAPNEIADIILINPKTGELQKLGETRSWNVQQGCMMQWLGPDYLTKIIYNDFRNNEYCCVIFDLDTKKERIINKPIYSVSEDGKTALTLDFSRLHRLRPGYGYSNIKDKYANDSCPNQTCIWKIDLINGFVKPLLKYTDFLKFETRPEMVGAEHKVNHIMLNPSGERFMVIHRWKKGASNYSRLVTCDCNGTELFNLSDDNFVSHCTWKNDYEILSYLNKKKEGKGYYLLKDRSYNRIALFPELPMDGHPSYSPNRKMIVTDTYPNRKRIQSLYIINDDKVKILARVFSPFKYKGNFRCDLHPRWNFQSTKICIDATFEGKRGLYSINV